MTPIVFFCLLGAMLLGIALIVVGRRGRRLNDHPVCRTCHFDLNGVYPGGVTCPECGGGLKREGSVRIGARRRMHTLTALGILLVLLPVTPIAVTAYGALTGTDVNKYKPLGLMLWEAPHVSAKGPSEAIANELMDRMLKGKLSKQQEERVVEVTLALQKDVSKPWSEAWGALIE